MNDLIMVGDALATLQTMPSNSVHCWVTSPPYLWLRNYGVAGQIGLEDTVEEYLRVMTLVMSEARRVLRDDGTLWLNLGDSYAGSGRGPSGKSSCMGQGQEKRQGFSDGRHAIPDGAKPKDLLGIPWQVAFALRSAGWFLRSDIIWHKPNPQPSSIKDRPGMSHEYLFLLSKSPRYFYDWWAVREASVGGHDSGNKGRKSSHQPGSGPAGSIPWTNQKTRNRRTVWTIAPRQFRDTEGHYATFPPGLVTPCVMAGTSEHGACAECGAPFKRIVVASEAYAKHLGRDWADATGKDDAEGRGHFTFPDGRKSTTMRTKRDAPALSAQYDHGGWERTCAHEGAGVVPCVVGDIFSGMATTGLVARSLGRKYLGIELSPKYAERSAIRLRDAAPDGRPLDVIGTGQAVDHPMLAPLEAGFQQLSLF